MSLPYLLKHALSQFLARDDGHRPPLKMKWDADKRRLRTQIKKQRSKNDPEDVVAKKVRHFPQHWSRGFSRCRRFQAAKRLSSSCQQPKLHYARANCFAGFLCRGFNRSADIQFLSEVECLALVRWRRRDHVGGRLAAGTFGAASAPHD